MVLDFEPISGQSTDGTRILNTQFISPFRTGYVRCKGVCMPEYYVNFAEDIINMDVRDDDVWVCSFPKTGTTWTQEMVWCIANNLDFEAAKVFLPERFPFLEHTPLFDYRNKPELQLPVYVRDSVGHISNLPGRRFIKAHLPLRLLPKKLQDGSTKAKIIYVTRNPKDTCVSYYHHCQLLEGYRGNFEDFFKIFLDGLVCFGPFWEHVLEFWEASKRNPENILFLKYEDMKKDLKSIIQQTGKFLDHPLSTPDILQLEDHLSFESMKENRATNYELVIEINKENNLIDKEKCERGAFMRSGKIGGWKALMTNEMSNQVNLWTKDNLAGSDFSF
ncbi:hypothetical protein M8J77_005566 [Diaphorina citri]|nr:hypothetical protein M8J77_005566 [Diaphorina citri]